MSFLKRLFDQNTTTAVNENQLIENHTCPNCWGKQEYEGKFQQYVQDQTKANINHDKLQQKAFIQQFIENHVSGIKLNRVENQLTCPKCKKKYQTKSKQ